MDNQLLALWSFFQKVPAQRPVGRENIPVWIFFVLFPETPAAMGGHVLHRRRKRHTPQKLPARASRAKAITRAAACVGTASYPVKCAIVLRKNYNDGCGGALYGDKALLFSSGL